MEKNCDLDALTSNLTSKNDAFNDEVEDLKNDNHDLISKNKKYTEEIHQLKMKKGLSTKFDNSNTYNRLNLSPVAVTKLQNCTEWWCPKHSNFKTIIKTYKPKSDEDKAIIRRVKGRVKYWNNKDNEEKCCKNDRQYKDSNKFFSPSNWPKSKMT
ncbi:uncharacterized protein LOC112604280 [Melanaphis sacchari]|uniref:uncharacterized protein LOC112604280 n=1 Tax=Melanaphis sacchari TaxID=742174 RepID=UPI000DC15985|nr:uncharacterized protein LOC112604280 [Melanaphis sacchari]